MRLNLLIDTDVLIDVLRGIEPAIQFLQSSEDHKFVSCVTVVELYAGVKEGKEKTTLDRFMRLFDVIPIDNELAKAAGLIKRDYANKSGTGFADAIIAATAIHHRYTLVTLNKKHFAMLQNILIPYHKS